MFVPFYLVNGDFSLLLIWDFFLESWISKVKKTLAQINTFSFRIKQNNGGAWGGGRGWWMRRI